jgi:hypothetical protein
MRYKKKREYFSAIRNHNVPCHDDNIVKLLAVSYSVE